MEKPFLPENEADRLKALVSYEIMDSLPESGFDEITQLASQICETPISLITLVDDKRQWFKSKQGLEITETVKENAFCFHAIQDPKQITIVSNSLEDERFKNNPLVVGQPHVIFYAGVPLVNAEGYPLGTLCVIDNQPKKVSEIQINTLKVLAKQVMNQLELRKKIRELNQTAVELQKSQRYLERFAVMASHDIKTPLTSIILSAQMLKLKYWEQVDDKANLLLDTINHSSKKLLGYLNTMLDYSKSNIVLAQKKDQIYVNDLLEHVLKLLNIPENISVNTYKQDIYVKTSFIALEQIFIHLLHNAIKYNNKANGLINISFSDENKFYRFKISDNGNGISPCDVKALFKHHTLINDEKPQDKKAKIGLSTVKNLIESLGGEIKVESVLTEGTTFIFTIKK